MARVRKDSAGSVSGGYTWDKAGAVIDVPDALATELCAIPGGGFRTVPEDAVLTPPPGEGEPLTSVPQPATFPAGQTAAAGSANQIPPGLPAHSAPVPAGWAAPGGELASPDSPHGRTAGSIHTPHPPEVQSEAQVVSAAQDPQDDDEEKAGARPPQKAARARANKRISE